MGPKPLWSFAVSRLARATTSLHCRLFPELEAWLHLAWKVHCGGEKWDLDWMRGILPTRFIPVEEYDRSVIFAFKEPQEFSASAQMLPHSPPPCHHCHHLPGPVFLFVNYERSAVMIITIVVPHIIPGTFTGMFLILAPLLFETDLHFMNNNNCLLRAYSVSGTGFLYMDWLGPHAGLWSRC